MPADAPGTLSRPQVADLVAYMLQANQFPAGSAELGVGDAALKQISLGRPRDGRRAPRRPDRRCPFRPPAT